MPENPDVLLFSAPRPPWISPRAFEVSENSGPPLGLLYLAGALEKAGHRVKVVDCYRGGLTPRAAAEQCAVSRPSLVGVSSLTSNIDLALATCRHVKAACPGTITVIGGPHVTSLPAEVLLEPAVDIIVRGEGEQTLVEILELRFRDGLEPERLSCIPGIGFRRGKDVVLTPERDPLNVDQVELPARHLIDLSRYLQVGAVLASRGCPHKCFFCASVGFRNHAFRYRDPRAVVNEMEDMHDRLGIEEFEFVDDALTADTLRVRELCRLLAPHRFRWGCQAALKDIVTTPDLIEEMAKAGCKGIFFGVESGNASVLRKVKGLDPEIVIQSVRQAQDHGMRVVTSFMIGHPWDTRETIEDTVELMLKFREMGCHTPLSVMVPFPGSPLANDPERFGITIESRDYRLYYHNRALVSTQHLTRQELDDIYFNILERMIPGECATVERDVSALPDPGNED